MEHRATTLLVQPQSTDPEFVKSIHQPSIPQVPTIQSPPVAPEERPSLGRRLLSEGGLVFVVSLAIYFVISGFLDFKYHSFIGDSFSRDANGFYILYSRDPHLAAVGFVWEPLTSLCDMFFLLGNHLWPALAHDNVAGSLTSAIAMAGVAYQLLAALREWGVSRNLRLVLVAFFILDPMILFYSGNGMSEGLYMFTLMAATRYLMRWIHTGEIRSIAYAGVALGFSYLTRNEAAASIIAGAAAVALVSYWRESGSHARRRIAALGDATIFAVPGVIAASGWAVVSFVITGSFFGQYSSMYGSSAQEALLSHEKFNVRDRKSVV